MSLPHHPLVAQSPSGDSSAPTNARYRWGVLTDLHLAATGTPNSCWHNTVSLGQSRELLSTALAQLRQEQVQQLIVLGDLSDTASHADYHYLLDQVDKSRLPTWLIPGNHDCPAPAPDESRHCDTVLAAASARSTPLSAHGHDLNLDLDRLLIISGALNPRGLEQYTLTLDPPPAPPQETMLVVLTHFPILNLAEILTSARLDDAGNLTNRAHLAAGLTDWPGPVLVLHGHQHIRSHKATANILQLGFAAIAEQPHDLATLDITVETNAHHDHSLVVHVARRCHTLAPRPRGWRRSLLDPDHTDYRWTRGTWQAQPGADEPNPGGPTRSAH